MKTKPIPTDDNGWLEYLHNVYIIKIDKKGNLAEFQTSGVMCRPNAVQGFVVKGFDSTNNWFQPDYWYNCYHDIGGLIPMKNLKPKEVYNGKHKEKTVTYETIQQIVKDEVKQEMGWDIEITAFEEAACWFTYKDENYLLTWLNCD